MSDLYIDPVEGCSCPPHQPNCGVPGCQGGTLSAAERKSLNARTSITQANKSILRVKKDIAGAILSQRYKLRGAFNLMDTNQSHKVTKTEFSHGLMNLLNHQITQAQIDQLWAESDTDRNNKLDWKEFLAEFKLEFKHAMKNNKFSTTCALRKHGMACLQGLLMQLYDGSSDSVRELYELTDRNSDGKITKTELYKVLNSRHSQELKQARLEDREIAAWAVEAGTIGVRKADVDELFAALDLDGSGSLSIDEFLDQLTVVRRKRKKDIDRFKYISQENKLDRPDAKCSRFTHTLQALEGSSDLDLVNQYIGELIYGHMCQQIPQLVRFDPQPEKNTGYQQLEFQFGRTLDIQKSDHTNEIVAFVIFYVNYISDVHTRSCYHCRLVLNPPDSSGEETLKNMETCAVRTEEDYQETSAKGSNDFDDWPEKEIFRYD